MGGLFKPYELEVIGNSAIVITAIGIEGPLHRIAHDWATIGRSGRTGTVGVGRPRHGVGPDIEDVVGAERELELVGEVVPAFQVGNAHARLVEGDFLAAGVRADVGVLRPVKSLAEGGAKIIQRSVGRQNDFLGRRGMRVVILCLEVEEGGRGI